MTQPSPSLPQVVSTVIGSTVAIVAGWLVLPQYGSSRMLRRQAGALRATLRLLHDMHVEVAAAAAETRGVRAAGWLPAIEDDIQVGPCHRGTPACGPGKNPNVSFAK
jgi:hypothetical protein